MAYVQVSAPLPAGSDTGWRRFGSFQGVGEWHPLLARVEGRGEEPGALRKAISRDGQERVERLREFTPLEHFYRYTIVSTGMPVRDYRGRIHGSR